MMWSSNGKNKPSQIEQLLILQEKVPVIIKFKLQNFVLPTPKEFVLRKKNHSTFPPSNLGFPSFLPKKNSSSHSKTNSTFFLEKGDFFILPFLSSSSFLSTVLATSTTIVVATTGVDYAAENDIANAAKAKSNCHPRRSQSCCCHQRRR